MGKITTKELSALTEADHNRVIREDGGLTGKVRAGVRGVTILFRYEYWLEGSKRDHRLGSWPKKSLADIRTERDKLRVSVSDGIDPNAAKKAARIEKQQAVHATIAAAEATRKAALMVIDLYNDWIENGVARKDGNAELARLFSKDVLPVIGCKELRLLTDAHIREMLRKQRKRGVIRQTIITFSDLRQMLAWGEKRQPWRGLLVDGNPADLVDIEKLIPDDYTEERNRVLLPEEIRELADIFTRTTAEYEAAPAGKKYDYQRPLQRETQIALWLCLGTLCRIGELLMAKPEHVDLDKDTWFIPRSNTKGRRQQKQEHTVLLSPFTKRLFQELKDLVGDAKWLFPARNKVGEESHICLKTVSRQVGDRQTQFKKRSKPLSHRRHDDSLVLGGGKNGEWTPHDLRRTGATMMQEIGIGLDIIDRCQNHVMPGSKVRRHYLHYDYATEKAEAWKRLGERIEEILAE
ncbi:tyrosine-type recombinase/integrase [Castellaniella sp.]|uniref:tyrosine-type recombinase/integrase n=1 Tax=Castellaniella sp. TaxID=1955812 RepID=UPI002AFF8167|nr:tyrosine-type recombinase/integrase [Castellaniella sp.]